MNIGYASNILAMNITHTGEMGWVLYIPNEYALYVYECLLNRGKEYNLTLAGHYAMRTLRIERFYAFWGQDIDSTTTPFECGRAFRVKFEVKPISCQIFFSSVSRRTSLFQFQLEGRFHWTRCSVRTTKCGNPAFLCAAPIGGS